VKVALLPVQLEQSVLPEVMEAREETEQVVERPMKVEVEAVRPVHTARVLPEQMGRQEPEVTEVMAIIVSAVPEQPQMVE
jgi:hypothetical protein